MSRGRSRRRADKLDRTREDSDPNTHHSLSLKDKWLEFVLELSLRPAAATVGTRKMLRGVEWAVTGEEWNRGKLPLETAGYVTGGAKLNQLKRYYLNPEELSRAVTKYKGIVRKGAFNSVGMTLKNYEKKGFTKNDHCMQALVVSYWPPGRQRSARTEIDVFYRVTEVAKKFVGDLLLFREHVFPLFKPNRIRFLFHTVNVSTIFTPVLLLSLPKPVEFLEKIRKQDEMHWRRICIYTRHYLDNKKVMKFRQRQRLQKFMQATLAPATRQQIQEYLDAHLHLLQRSVSRAKARAE